MRGSIPSSSRAALPTFGCAAATAPTSSTGVVGGEPEASSHLEAATGPLFRADSIGAVSGADSDSASFPHETPALGLQRASPRDSHECGVSVCGGPTAALQETALHPGSQQGPQPLDMKNAAIRIHGLSQSLHIERARVVGHDIGLMVAYAYAAMYPTEVEKLVVMDAFLPGVEGWEPYYNNPSLWHFRFHGPTPEALVAGREKTYFAYFWNDLAAD